VTLSPCPLLQCWATRRRNHGWGYFQESKEAVKDGADADNGGGMKIAGPIAVCSADPPLDRWNGWVNCPLSSGMMKLGFSLTIRLETLKRSLIDLWRHTNSTIERL
jgi:hypothetical protein